MSELDFISSGDVYCGDVQGGDVYCGNVQGGDVDGVDVQGGGDVVPLHFSGIHLLVHSYGNREIKRIMPI